MGRRRGPRNRNVTLDTDQKQFTGGKLTRCGMLENKHGTKLGNLELGEELLAWHQKHFQKRKTRWTASRQHVGLLCETPGKSVKKTHCRQVGKCAPHVSYTGLVSRMHTKFSKPKSKEGNESVGKETKHTQKAREPMKRCSTSLPIRAMPTKTTVR